MLHLGVDLSDLAAEYSVCPSKKSGGMLGWVKKGQMVCSLDIFLFLQSYLIFHAYLARVFKELTIHYFLITFNFFYLPVEGKVTSTVTPLFPITLMEQWCVN